MTDYAVITPVRNEAERFPHTLASMLAQSRLPLRWVIVDDGSTDQTGKLADAAATKHNWIRVVHRTDRGHRKPGSGVMEAFYDGLAKLDTANWHFLAKLDGDLFFDGEYFQRCIEHFKQDPRLGIGGGMVCLLKDGKLIPESGKGPTFHVRGATKIYRRACWKQIGGLLPAVGWDTIDELKANMLGWRTQTFADLQVCQLKSTGSADGYWRNWTKNGLANYVAGYHPLFMLAKCLRRICERPYGMAALALWWGYCKAWIDGISRVPDPELIRFVRRQQLNKLCFRSSLW